jgi:hypothetical protein
MEYGLLWVSALCENINATTEATPNASVTTNRLATLLFTLRPLRLRDRFPAARLTDRYRSAHREKSFSVSWKFAGSFLRVSERAGVSGELADEPSPV